MNQTFTQPLLDWYAQNKRDLPWRRDNDPYHVWLSEVMLQQTRVQAVIPYYERFLQHCPTVSDLAALSEDVLFKLWEGLGYYSRARNLHKAACIIAQEYDGKFPADWNLLRKLPGVGEYTAGAVASIAFGLPTPAIDGNVLRVLSRFYAKEDCIDLPQTKRAFYPLVMELLPSECSGTFNQALMDLGATCCIPNGMPLCEQCPVKFHCAAHASGRMLDFPVRAPKKKRTIVHRTILVFQHESKIALRKRKNTGLLAGLWEFPAYESALSRSAVAKQLVQDGFSPIKITPLPSAKHIFTHLEWHMKGYHVRVSDTHGENFVWVSPEQLSKEYALPHAFQSFRNVTID